MRKGTRSIAALRTLRITSWAREVGAEVDPVAEPALAVRDGLGCRIEKNSSCREADDSLTDSDQAMAKMNLRQRRRRQWRVARNAHVGRGLRSGIAAGVSAGAAAMFDGIKEGTVEREWLIEGYLFAVTPAPAEGRRTRAGRRRGGDQRAPRRKSWRAGTVARGAGPRAPINCRSRAAREWRIAEWRRAAWRLPARRPVVAFRTEALPVFGGRAEPRKGAPPESMIACRLGRGQGVSADRVSAPAATADGGG